MTVGSRVYPILHPDGKRSRVPRHDRSDLGTVIAANGDKLVVEWDTGEVDQCDATTRRDDIHPWTVKEIRT